MDDFLFNGKLTFGGFHARRLSPNEHSRVLEGFNLFFGPSIAFEHNEYALEEFRDRLGVVHLPGSIED